MSSGSARSPLLGLGLPELLAARETQSGSGLGHAKACIVLFMWGGPAQQDTWDLKPDAPAEYRGEFKPIADHRARAADLRAPAAARPAGRQAGDHPLDDARRRQPHRPPPHYLLTGQAVAAPGAAAGRGLAELRGRAGQARPRQGAAAAVRVDDAGRARTGRRGSSRRSHGQGAGWLGPLYNPMRIDADASKPGLPASANSPCAPTCRTPRPTTARRCCAELDRPGARRWSSAPHARRLRPHYDRAFALPGRAGGDAGVRPVARAAAGPRALRHEHPRPVGAAGPPAGRGRRAAGHGLLAERRHHQRQRLLGHAQPQLHRPEDTPLPGDRPGVLRPARRPRAARACSTRRWSSGPARWAARRGSASAWSAGPGPAGTAATTGRTASPASWPAAGIKGGIVHGASDRYAAYPATNPSPRRPGGDDLSLPRRRPANDDPGQTQPPHGRLRRRADSGPPVEWGATPPPSPKAGGGSRARRFAPLPA